jgi:hypothetical protein
MSGNLFFLFPMTLTRTHVIFHLMLAMPVCSTGTVISLGMP